MRLLLATTGLGAIATCLTAVPANAETVISTAITTPVLTGTANDDIRISSTGSVKPAGGAAVTINSNDSVKNEGAIAITGANNATGILANANLTGDITNIGTITIDEAFTPTDTDNDGDLDGPFAQGTGRFGIHVLGGGTFTGNVLNSGTITVEGNQSAGIAIDSALIGSLSQTGGLITVTGNDSAGIRAADVSGNVILSNGVIAVKGQNSIGLDLTGDIGGALVIQNAISATGYRNTSPPADVTKLDADDLLQGGPAVSVAGDVAGGILLDARPADLDPNDTDEDNDGVADASELTAAITSFGAAPALRIGSATVDTAIGAVASSTDGYGIVVKGTVVGSGVYKGVNATAISVGGLGHLVNVAGGMGVSGTVSASAVEGNATAIRLGAGANVPVVNISGNVGASGGGTATTGSQTILIETGANVGTIKNSGTILAVRAGTDGSASAIVDQSGGLSLVENSGSIGVTDFATLGDKAVAIDLHTNTTGATVRQIAAATGKPAPEIKGNILFGTGADTLDVLAGSVFGKVDFGGGADVFNLAGGSLFRGTLAGSAGLALTVGTGSTLDLQNLGTVDLASLNVAHRRNHRGDHRRYLAHALQCRRHRRFRRRQQDPGDPQQRRDGGWHLHHHRCRNPGRGRQSEQRRGDPAVPVQQRSDDLGGRRDRDPRSQAKDLGRTRSQFVGKRDPAGCAGRGRRRLGDCRDLPLGGRQRDPAQYAPAADAGPCRRRVRDRDQGLAAGQRPIRRPARRGHRAQRPRPVAAAGRLGRVEVDRRHRVLQGQRLGRRRRG